MVGVIEISKSSIQTFRNILQLKAQIEVQLVTLGKKQPSALRLLQFLFSKPVVNAKDVADAIQSSALTANSPLADFVQLEILQETAGYQRNRIFHTWICFEFWLSSTTKQPSWPHRVPAEGEGLPGK